MTITGLDWAVLVAYLVTITAIGLIAGRRVRRSNEYFLGGRRFGPWVMISQSFTVGTHAEMPVALAGAVYGIGASAIWYQWKNLFITPLYWVMAPVFRRIRRTTTAEFMEDRYGPFMGAVYIVFALCFFIIETGGLLKGAAKVISQATGGTTGVNEIVAAMTAMFILYSFVGGLVASARTDVFQGVLIIVLSFMLIPLGWRVVGGLGGMKASLAPFQFSLSTPSGVGPWVIAMLTVNGLVGIMAQPHMLATVGTGRDERTCRVGMLFGNFVKRVCTVGWMLVGLITAAMVAQGSSRALTDPENAFGFACRQLLFPGALGLLVASILAASMSACSAYMVDVGALFTEGFYRATDSSGRERPALSLGRARQRGCDHDARRPVRDVPDRKRAVHLPAHRDPVDVRRHRPARRSHLAAREPMGRARESRRRAAHELLPVLDRGRAVGPLGSERVPRGARGGRGGARGREPDDRARARAAHEIPIRSTGHQQRLLDRASSAARQHPPAPIGDGGTGLAGVCRRSRRSRRWFRDGWRARHRHCAPAIAVVERKALAERTQLF